MNLLRYPVRKTGLFTTVFASLLLTLLQPFVASALELSNKPIEHSWPTHDWDGKHSFPPVYCLTFPTPNNAISLTDAMFNKNSISLVRVAYQNNTALYIATSVIPVERSPEEDVAKTKESNNMNAQRAPNNIKVLDSTSPFGSTVGVVIRNPAEQTQNGPFPLSLNLTQYPDKLLHSLSVHRLIARGPDRIEIVALRFFPKPLTSDNEQAEVDSLTGLVNATLESTYTCTSLLPIRAR